MENIAIYYQLSENDTTDSVLEKLDAIIQELKIRFNIKGVFIDADDNENELFELLQSPLTDIDYILLNREPKDEFFWFLLRELSRNERFNIKYFSEFKGLI